MQSSSRYEYIAEAVMSSSYAAYTLLKQDVNEMVKIKSPSVTFCGAAALARESIFASPARVAFSLSQAAHSWQQQFLCDSVP